MSRRVTVFLAVLALLAAGYVGYSQLEPGMPADINVGTTPVAIHGYDPVAYHTLGTPTQGSPEFTVEHEGAVFQFASEEHQALFEGDPETYMPAYGGFCAYGVTQKQKFDIDPQAWEIVDGKLYLQLDPGTRSVWLENREDNIRTADAIWPEIRPVPAEDL